MLPDFSKVRALVVGDPILDQYLELTDTERKDPATGTPVLLISKGQFAPGGAANVAAGIKALGCDVTYLYHGEYGPENAALVGMLLKAGVKHAHIKSNAQIPLKTRCGSVMRMDKEDARFSAALPGVDQRDVMQEFWNLLGQKLDVVVISDYAKGMLSDSSIRSMIHLCSQRSIPTVCDPKRSLSVFRGCTVLKANQHEFAAHVRYARDAILPPDTVGECLYVTRGEKVSTVYGSNFARDFDPTSKNPVDATGCGDTVTAVLAACVGAKVKVEECCRLANAAAGVAVERKGTHAVTLDELKRAFPADDPKPGRWTAKEVLRPAARSIIERWKRQKERIVFVNGCFDLLHYGHQCFLEAAGRMGTKLVVGLNSDASVRRLKGPSRPVMPDAVRLHQLNGLACVHLTVFFDDDTPEDLIRDIKPDVLVRASDDPSEKPVGHDIVPETVILPKVPGYSTTELIRRIKGLA